jgi:hypothetical protein
LFLLLFFFQRLVCCVHLCLLHWFSPLATRKKRQSGVRQTAGHKISTHSLFFFVQIAEIIVCLGIAGFVASRVHGVSITFCVIFSALELFWLSRRLKLCTNENEITICTFNRLTSTGVVPALETLCECGPPLTIGASLAVTAAAAVVAGVADSAAAFAWRRSSPGAIAHPQSSAASCGCGGRGGCCCIDAGVKTGMPCTCVIERTQTIWA